MFLYINPKLKFESAVTCWKIDFDQKHQAKIMAKTSLIMQIHSFDDVTGWGFASLCEGGFEGKLIWVECDQIKASHTP
jgi:hypothetical protein